MNSSTRLIKLVVKYDGTDFCGFAAQTGLRTVRGTLTEAVRHISGEETEILGASRTDSGAHALGQVCQFDTRNPIPVERWARALNRRLPADLAIVEATQEPSNFHVRFCAHDRRYRYRILNEIRDPHRERYAYFYDRRLDVERMQFAAAQLLGTHDFLAFSEELSPNTGSTVRHLFKVQVRRVRDEVWVDVVGTAFLRGMMRKISGCLLEIGLGRRPIEEVSKLLSVQERHAIQWPVVLPAKGLCLMRVTYKRPYRDIRQTSVLVSSSDAGSFQQDPSQEE